MASTIFGSFNNEQQVTVNGNQQVRGRKTFLNAGNEYAGTFVDPTFTVNGVSITSTEISYLEDAAGNIQDQLDDKLSLTGGEMSGPITSASELDFVAPSNINIQSTSGGDIVLNAPNLTSYGFALPICFDFYEIDRNYGYSGGQAWEMIWQQDVTIPPQFFSESPGSGYASVKWRIDFTINTWNNGSGNNSSDKFMAYYIIFEDPNSNPITPLLITPNTPFCRHNNNSTWNGGGLSEFQPFSWTDLVDFSDFVGTQSSQLRFKVYFAADNPKNFNFSYKVGLTKTTRI